MGKNIIPYSCEAEQAVLGGLMLDNERWDEVIEQVLPEDFFSGPHRRIFQAMAELARERSPLDLITLSDRLENHELLDQCGGFGYLAEMSKNTPSATNVLAYAGVVAEKSRLRQLLIIGNSLITEVNTPRAVAGEILESAEKRLFSLAEREEMRNKGENSINHALDNVLGRLESRACNPGITGTPTGFRELDVMTCGLQATDLVLLAGRTSMGKTAFALKVCISAVRAKPDCHVMVFSLEMSEEQLIMRLLAIEGQVELERLRSGHLAEEHWAKIADAAGRIADWKNRLIIDDNSKLTPAKLRARALRYTRKYGRPCLILVDYLQLMRCPGQENRTQELAEISGSMKALAKELDCPVLALSQLNRQLELRPDKRPNNSDLRDSGSLEQDADLILLIYRDEVYHPTTTEPGVAEIIVSKQRQGPTGTVKVKFDGRYTLFSDFNDVSKHHGRSPS